LNGQTSPSTFPARARESNGRSVWRKGLEPRVTPPVDGGFPPLRGEIDQFIPHQV
jgi:hypothetical protein